MKQYGVSTSGQVNYSGTAVPSVPTTPAGTRPAGEDAAAKAAQGTYDKQLADFNAYKADPAAFNETMRKYGLDQKSYDEYKTNYQTRLQNTPMYSDLQFQKDPAVSIPQSLPKYKPSASNVLTPDIAISMMQASKPGGGGVDTSEFNRYGGYDKVKAAFDAAGGNYAPIVQQPGAKTVADLYKMYLGRDPEAGIVGTEAASTRPNFIQEAQRELSTKPTFGNQNLMDITGSYYGNQLTSPTYGAMPASMINATPQEKSDYYLKQRNFGYNNADLRTASENTFGKVNEGDWAQMTARAYPTYNANIVDAYKSIGRSWDQGTIDAPGYNYWMNQVSSGAFDPKNLNSTFAKILADQKAADAAKVAASTPATVAPAATVVTGTPAAVPYSPYEIPENASARGGSVHSLAAKYAYGGQVKTNYQTGGGVSSPGQVAAYYKQRSRDGYTDSEIRAASDNIFGTSSDADWQYIKTIANVNPAPTMSSTGVGPINIAGTSGGYGGGGNDPYVDPNPAWTNLSNEGKAAYFAANPIEANLNALAIYGFKNTPLGAIQNYFDPNLQQQLLTNLSSNFAPVESRGTALNDSIVSGRNQDVQNNDLDAIPGSYTYGGGLENTLGDQTGDYPTEGGTGQGIGGSDISGQTDSPSSDNIGSPAIAKGGRIKTHYQTAGAVRLPSGYGSIDEEEDFNRRFRIQPEAVTSPVNMTVPPAPVTIEPEPVPATVITDAPKSVLTKIAVNNVRDADAVNAMNESAGALSVPVDSVAPVAAVPKAAMPLGGDRMANMQAMLAAYGPKDSAYAADLKIARDRAKADSDAFAKMLTDSMKSPEDAQSSKAEMYFRLAAAFGAPTKTGQFSENLGMVGKELGEFAKGKRTSAREKQLLGLEAQKLKMASSKEDLNTLRALSAEEMKDKRAIATELIKDYIKSGEPQSAAGKQARDEGFKEGTEAYQKRVAEIGNMKTEALTAQVTSALSGVSLAQANFALNEQKFRQQQDQQSKLTGPEIKMKDETSQALVTMRDAYADIKKALELNENAYDGSVIDQAQYKLLSSAGSKDPKVVNTGVLDNLLKLGALSTAATTLKTQISDSDMKMLNQVQGSGAKSKQERAAILEAAKVRMRNLYMQKKAKLAEINSGAYRETSSTSGELD
jgi:hypothetical protein